MMAAVSAEIKARKERGEIKTREQETQEMGKYIGAIFAFREYERRRGMAARHERPAPEAAYKKGDVIGGKYEVACWAGVALGKCIWFTAATPGPSRSRPFARSFLRMPK